jgi:hypothetical protein
MNATLLLAMALLADGDLPPAEQLIHKAIEIRRAQDAKGLKYTWREEVEFRDDKGRPLIPFRKTYDVIMLEGRNYDKLVLVDGRPLDGAMQQKVDADMAKERELRRKHPFLAKAVPFGGLGQLERLFDSTVVGEEIVNGRKAWKVESEPRRGVKAANPREEEILATRRTTWFDEEEGAEVRRRTVYVRSVHSIKTDSYDDLEWSKVGDDWLLASNHQRTHVSPAPGFNSFGDAHFRYFDYRRFAVESTFTPEQ